VDAVIFNWIVHPAAAYVLLATGLVMCIYLFTTLKRDLRHMERRLVRRCQAMDKLIGGFQTATEELRSGLHEAEERAGLLVAPAPPKSGLNLSKRSQVLRMARLGASPEKIAAVLSLPQNEVDLLLKVHHIMLHQLSHQSPVVSPPSQPAEEQSVRGLTTDD
jgi:hypothetical protein